MLVSMSVFYLMALLFANLFQQHTALIQMEHANHVHHIVHVQYLTYLEDTKPKPVVPVVLPLPAKTTTAAPQPTPVSTYVAPLGDYSCSALESLWVSAGGNPASEFIAAQIATAESGGNPNAISPTSDYGLWQINSSNAPGSEMLNPQANVREAIALSGNGANWSPWTTYTSGIYASEC